MSGSEVKPQRQSQVNEQVSRLEGNLTTLHDSIGKLQDRLSAVLRSSVLSEQEKGKDSVELVVLACTIEGSADSVRSATHRVEDILDRLEL
jgi:uncharacterized protein YlxW (UPF0749 family)